MKLDVALTALITILSNASQLSQMILKARAEGRDGLSDEEVAVLKGKDDEARAALQAALDA